MEISDKKIIIYGDNRLKEDFEYIFDGLKIERCINDSNYTDILNIDLETIIILIVDNDLEKIISKFNDIGLKYNKHFFLAKDFFCNLLFFKDRKISIWGTGEASKLFVKTVNCTFDCYIDNDTNKRNTIINGKVVKHSNDICDLKDNFIVVASSYYDEIRKNLIDLNLIESENFINYRLIIQFLDMFDKFVYSTDKKNIHCDYPFTTCDIVFHGNVSICCFMGSYPIGNIKYNNIKEIWSSVYVKMIRRSVINKTFCYCYYECPLWQKESSDNLIETEVPYRVGTDMDYTCNLSCPQCRDRIKIAEGKEYAEMDFIADRIIQEVIPNVNNFGLAGNGEVFFSKPYRKILKHKNLQYLSSLYILSNGILFNEENWNIIKQHNLKDICLGFSVDAATEETYQKLRRGGNFNILIKNLKFASYLKRNKEINSIKLYFVIQRDNYREMPEFVKLGKSIDADYISFTRIRNCVGYSNEQFSKISMYDDNNKPLEELKEILQNPIFNDPVVELDIDIIG